MSMRAVPWLPPRQTVHTSCERIASGVLRDPVSLRTLAPPAHPCLLHVGVDMFRRAGDSRGDSPTHVVLSRHALDRMAQRGISLEDVLFVVARGVATPDAAPSGSAPRSRMTAVRHGRRITAVIAHEPDRVLVITVF